MLLLHAVACRQSAIPFQDDGDEELDREDANKRSLH